MDEFGQRIREAREARGWSQEALAERVGATQSTIDRIENGNTRRSRVLPEVAMALNLPFPVRGASKATPASAAAPLVPAWTEAPDAPEIDKNLYPREVPVLGLAACGDDGDFQLNGHTGDYVRRPPGLERKFGVYALHLAGESMYPAYKHGDLIYVDPNREPGPGEDAVIELLSDADGEPGPGFLKRVVRVRGGKIECEQFNPPGPVTFDRSKVKRFHRVIPWSEVLGY